MYIPVVCILLKTKVMVKNIRIEYKNGVIDRYITQSTEDLHLPSLGFSTEEEAELAVAVAKTLRVHNKSIINLDNTITYIFRVLGIRNDWTD